jgi:hypothetical protein
MSPNGKLTFEVDFQHPLRFEFMIQGGDKFVRSLFDKIEMMCPQTDYLMRFWQIKHALNSK